MEYFVYIANVSQFFWILPYCNRIPVWYEAKEAGNKSSCHTFSKSLCCTLQSDAEISKLAQVPEAPTDTSTKLHAKKYGVS